MKDIGEKVGMGILLRIAVPILFIAFAVVALFIPKTAIKAMFD